MERRMGRGSESETKEYKEGRRGKGNGTLVVRG